MKLQDRVVAWHMLRFPDAEDWMVALKMSSEAGEVADAINSIYGNRAATGDGDAVKEAADVVIAAMVLVGRYFGGDVLEEVEKKLAVLMDPNSGHRAAIPPKRVITLEMGP